MSRLRHSVSAGILLAWTFTSLWGCSHEAATSAAPGDRAINQIDKMIAAANIDRTRSNWRTNVPRPDVAAFDSTHDYYVRMITSKGPILIKFMPDVAPMHVTNFAYLTRLGFYDGLAFHRVVPEFIAQGGDPTGNGNGGPGYQFAGEFRDDVRHDVPGRLSMANAGPGTDGSQFFLTFVPAPFLDGRYTIFGQVVEGLDTLQALENAGSPGGIPNEPLRMENVTVEVREKSSGHEV